MGQRWLYGKKYIGIQQLYSSLRLQQMSDGTLSNVHI